MTTKSREFLDSFAASLNRRCDQENLQNVRVSRTGIEYANSPVNAMECPEILLRVEVAEDVVATYRTVINHDATRVDFTNAIEDNLDCLRTLDDEFESFREKVQSVRRHAESLFSKKSELGHLRLCYVEPDVASTHKSDLPDIAMVFEIDDRSDLASKQIKAFVDSPAEVDAVLAAYK